MAQASSDFFYIEHVSKKVRSGQCLLTILQDINLSIKQGESIAILGASGSGKTTLLTLLAGLDLPTEGQIYFQNQHLNKLNEDARAQWRADNIGFIFQSFNLLPSMTALENVMLALEIQSFPSNVCVREAKVQLHKVGLSARLDHYPAQLSGGEQQRVAIARAFVTQPKIIFADEMTGNLDIDTGKNITELIFNLNKDLGTTLILVTHDEQLSSLCKRCYHLRGGELYPC